MWNSLFEGYYPWVVTVYHEDFRKEDGTSIQVNIDIRFSDIANYVDDVGIGSTAMPILRTKKAI